MFVDKVKIYVKAGNGGNGAVAFHREKYVAAGGPDGGDGGKGGNIVLRVNDNLSTLMDFRYKRKYTAPNGENGQGKTNLIESIWLFTGCHSFRTRKNSQLIRENCERSMLDISFFAFDRDQTARLELTDKKNVWINGVIKTLREDSSVSSRRCCFPRQRCL